MASDDRDCQAWWHAVLRIAHWVIREGIEPTEDGYFRDELLREGFSLAEIERAFAWTDHAALSGGLIEVLAMLAPASDSTRVEHPVERALLPERLFSAMESWRARGVLSHDLAERVLEGVRAIDTRDWDDEEVLSFMSDVISASAPHLTTDQVTKILRGRTRDYYC